MDNACSSRGRSGRTVVRRLFPPSPPGCCFERSSKSSSSRSLVQETRSSSSRRGAVVWGAARAPVGIERLCQEVAEYLIIRRLLRPAGASSGLINSALPSVFGVLTRDSSVQCGLMASIAYLFDARS